ncbi:hypothetical protein MVEN_00886700 [Mycena venus]|uniref:Uncharacterized protein n=1 Tax=Mycena venus TaxID=2733690 RepID=A0A8H6YFT5_9AGAR|nr:hypothetical protein MVEN_00886700 [Mycena venus]
MRISPLYRLGLALASIQCLCGWIAYAQTPDENGATDDKSVLTYREFLMLSTIFPALATLEWIWLIYMSRPKTTPSDSANVPSNGRRAGTHFAWMLMMAAHRILFVNLTFSPKRSDAFSALFSSCAATSFRTIACMPLGILLLFPAAEMLTFICAAYMIYRRSVAIHGREKVPLPPQYVPAWMAGDIAGLDLPLTATTTETKEAETV